VRIAPATTADLPALTAALGQPEFFGERLRGGPDEVVLVAWRDGVPVGDVVLRLSGADHPFIRERMPGRPMIYHLEVAPAHQRQGVGTALLDAAEAQARTRGHGLVQLLVETDNPEAERLYRRRGYDDWGNGPVEHECDQLTKTCHVLVKIVTEGVPGLGAWHAWHPREAARVLAGLDPRWYVVAGWALDLWHGRQTREHGDLEIAVARQDLPRVREHLVGAGYELYLPGGRELRRLHPADEVPADHHQMWVCEPAVPAWRMDVFSEPGDGRTWICRRDERIREPYDRIVTATPEGLPYLRPEAVLLFKAKHLLDKNEADLSLALPRLTPEARAWLIRGLELVHPGHPWLARLRPEPAST
jgi:GNAT superfamily N-acetyltransferase